ncbi:hypothetical protein Pcinc_008775 [Petrolisthes cinctipes]|uniref:MADF domain-containing protein n=1 Tax=Petrolisthes cinctipes TaxID=88211 RepID=A0AAE1G503_PETCI|nr:hypothetical protein Pcinc_009633 [Petrolisthes cinctipes]KAK3887088.1 hypothetical protein Pcinc_008775 [Petrolisthes cinctipes]
MKYDEPLINLVASCPWIYDTAHEKYKDIVMKRNSWKQIAQQLNMTGAMQEEVDMPETDFLLHHCKEHRTGGNSFQLGSSSSQPDSASSSNEAFPDTISPDNNDVLEIYISNDCDTPQVVAAGPAPQVAAAGPAPQVDAAGPAPATNTPKRKRAATDSVTPRKKAKLEGTDWQASLTQWVTAHQPKKTSTCLAVAAADYGAILQCCSKGRLCEDAGIMLPTIGSNLYVQKLIRSISYSHQDCAECPLIVKVSRSR